MFGVKTNLALLGVLGFALSGCSIIGNEKEVNYKIDCTECKVKIRYNKLKLDEKLDIKGIK